jgi:hypothetical protein
MKFPPLRRISFLLFELLVLIFPIYAIVGMIGGWLGATSERILNPLEHLTVVGFIGMTFWLIVFHQREPTFARIGLSSFLFLIFTYMAIPSIAE